MLKLASAARAIIAPPAAEPEEPATPALSPAAALREALAEAKPASLRNLERLTRIARLRRSELSDDYTAALHDLREAPSGQRHGLEARVKTAHAALVAADRDVGDHMQRLIAARESAHPRFNAAARPILADAGDRLAAAADVVEEAVKVVAVALRHGAENGRQSDYAMRAMPDPAALRALADLLRRGHL